MARSGISRSALTALSQAGLAPADLAWIESPSVHKQDGADVITVEEAARTLRLAKTDALAIEVLTSRERALHWLPEPRGGYAGMTFLELARTEVGADHVETLLRQPQSIFR